MPALQAAPSRAPIAVFVAALLLLVVHPPSLAAQELPLKRAVPDADASPCSVVPIPAEPSDAERAQAAELASTASRALILGDLTRARDLLARATELDGRSAQLAYRYGRVLEDSAARSQALQAYCRAVALGPEGPDAPDARARISALAPPAIELPSDEAVAAFRLGLDEADVHRIEGAATAFATAARLAPNWADAHYNRGTVLARLGQSAAAATALRRYLDLQPAGVDARMVSEWIGRLQAASTTALNPGTAVVLGVVPGLGQVYTGHAGTGLAFLGLTGTIVGSSAWAEEGDDRTFVTPGLYVAGGVTLVGALDAYFAARRRAADGRTAGLAPVSAFTLGLLPGMGQFYRGRTGAGFAVMSMAATSTAAAFLHEEGEGRGFFGTGLGTAAVITTLAALEASFDARRRQRGPGALPPAPGAALALGVVPGLGQFYQGRLGTGLGFVSLTAGLTAAANLAECCDRRGYVTPALGLAGAVTAVGALEAYLDARRVRRGPAAPLPNPGTALALGVIPGMGQFYSGRPAAGLTVLTLASGAAATSFLYEEGRGRGLFSEGFIAAGAITVIGAIEAYINTPAGSSMGGGGAGASGADIDAHAAPPPGTWVLHGPMLMGGGPGLGMRLLGLTF